MSDAGDPALGALFYAWPGAKSFDWSSGKRTIRFRCPRCDRDGALYLSDGTSGRLDCPSGCPPGDIERLMREGRTAAHDRNALRADPPRDASFAREVAKEARRLRVREAARAEVDEETAAELASDWAGITGDQINLNAPEPVPCVLEFAPGEFVFTPGVAVVFGPRGSAKSWLMLEAVRQELRRGRRAAIIDHEMSDEESGRRLVALGATSGELERLVYVHPRGPISDAGRAHLTARFADEPPSLVVIDSVGMSMGSMGLDGDKGRDVEAWATEVPGWLKSQWSDAVICAVDHVPKSADGGAVDPIGSQRKAAFADSLYLVQRMTPISRTTRGQGRLVVRKDRRGWTDEGAAVLDFTFGGGGPFELGPPDPHVVATSGDPGDAAADLLRVARHVGDNEGQMVEQVRTALDIRPNDFTALKDTLVGLRAIEHRPRAGLWKGERWQAYVDGVDLTDPDDPDPDND